MDHLIVSSITPTLRSGTGLRTYGVTAALARSHAVTLAYVEFGGAAPAPQYSALRNVTTRALRASRGPGRGVEFVRGVLRGIPAGVARGISPELKRAVDGTSTATRVIADGPVAAAALLPHARTRELIYLAHNLESGRARDEAERNALERFERRVLCAFSETWMATRVDERGARALAGEQIVTRYVPNVVDVGRIAPLSPAGTRRLLFVGDFTYAPNVEALEFLADAVLPTLWREMPDVRLLAVGSGLPDTPRDRRIETPGFVEDLAGAYRAADVVVVPLLRGGGSPLKFVEGLAYGLPLVATRHAAALLEDALPGRDFLLAGDTGEFAGSIATLLSDPARAAAIGRAGRKVAEACYSVDLLATLLGS